MINIKHVRNQLLQIEKKFSHLLFTKGMTHKEIASIRAKGDKALFGNYCTVGMKTKWGIPPHRPLADFLPFCLIQAKSIAIIRTMHSVVKNNLHDHHCIANKYVESNLAMRKTLEKKGIVPELLPAVVDIKLTKA